MTQIAPQNSLTSLQVKAAEYRGSIFQPLFVLPFSQPGMDFHVSKESRRLQNLIPSSGVWRASSVCRWVTQMLAICGFAPNIWAKGFAKDIQKAATFQPLLTTSLPWFVSMLEHLLFHPLSLAALVLAAMSGLRSKLGGLTSYIMLHPQQPVFDFTTILLNLSA